MKIAFCPSGKSYESELLRGLHGDGHEIVLLSDPGDVGAVLGLSGEPAQVAVVLGHADDAAVMGRCIELVRLEGDGARPLPRLVALSSLLTWAGAGGRVHGGAAAFARRTPALGCGREHAVENTLCGMHRAGLDVSVIGVGLVYGGGGFDFEDVFRAIFADDHSFQVPSVRGGSNVAPMIHYADLVGMVSRAVRARRGTADEFPDTPAEDTPPEAIFFTAATDGCEATLAQVLRRIGAGHLPFSPLEAALEAALRDPCVIKWNQDAVFPADRASLRFPDGLLTQFKDVWGEFLADQNLLPVSFVFAGPPGSGKTAAARALASSLGLQYVDALSTVRYIMGDAVGSDLANAPNPEKLSRMGSSTLNLSDIKDPHVALKSEISHILDAKAVELAAGAKGKKKDEAPVGETDYSGDALTEELCACLPTLLVRECVLMRINTDPKCIKKGYVLDVWKRLFSNLVEYLEMTLGHRPGQSEEPKEDSEDTEPSQKMQELYLAGGTALVVEIQMDNAALLQRYAASAGIDPTNPKLSKDQQAALKKAESSIDEYFAASQPAAMAESIEGGDVVTMARRAAARALGAADSRCDPGLQELEDVGAVVLRGFFGASAPAEEVAAHVKKCYDDIFPPILKQDPLIDTRTPTRTGVRLCPPVEVANMAEFSDNGEGPSAIEALNGQLASLGEDITKDIKIRNDNLQNYLVNTVMPHLSEMLVAIQRDRPEDPMKFAFEFLAERAQAEEQVARAQALELFTRSVAEAKALEERAAAVLDNAVKAAEVLSL